MVLELFCGIQLFEADGVVPGGFQGFGIPVPAVIHVLVQPGDPDVQRGVDEHRHPGVDAVQFIDQFLGPAQCEGQDVHDAAVGQGMVQGLCQGFQAVGQVFVILVPVSGFQDQEIAGVGQIRVRDNGGVVAAQDSMKKRCVRCANAAPAA